MEGKNNMKLFSKDFLKELQEKVSKRGLSFYKSFSRSLENSTASNNQFYLGFCPLCKTDFSFYAVESHCFCKNCKFIGDALDYLMVVKKFPIDDAVMILGAWCEYEYPFHLKVNKEDKKDNSNKLSREESIKFISRACNFSEKQVTEILQE